MFNLLFNEFLIPSIDKHYILQMSIFLYTYVKRPRAII